jgi:quinoprotein glucose dehydrogenase
MPAFSDLTAQDLNELAAYIDNPAGGALPQIQRSASPPAPAGQVRYYTTYGTLNANNGLPAIGPPWSTLTAYDLNAGTIQWQVPLGIVPELAARGITNTGSYHPTRNGVVATQAD